MSFRNLLLGLIFVCFNSLTILDKYFRIKYGQVCNNILDFFTKIKLLRVDNISAIEQFYNDVPDVERNASTVRNPTLFH